MFKFKQLLVSVALLLVLVSTSWAQATLTSTTLSAAVTSTSDQTFRVASATGFTAKTTVAYVDQELVDVTAVSGTTISVVRGVSGTRSSTHASGIRIYVGPPYYFSSYDRAGSCTATNERVLPIINTVTGNIWDCVNSTWELANYNLVSPIRSAGDYGRGLYVVDPSSGSFFNSSGAAKKTFAVEYSLTRSSSYAVTGDSNDAVIKGSYSNYAANDSNFQTRIYLGTMNNRSGGVVGYLNGAQFNASNKSGATASNVWGLEIGTENFGTNTGSHGGIDVHVKDEAAPPSDSWGIRLRNIDQSNVGAVGAAVRVPSNSGNTVGWNYAVDAYQAAIQEADFRTHTGAGVWSGTGAPTAGDCATATLGSIYLNVSGGANTSLYVCQTAGGWTAVTP